MANLLGIPLIVQAVMGLDRWHGQLALTRILFDRARRAEPTN
jgi:hypothetical protein